MSLLAIIASLAVTGPAPALPAALRLAPSRNPTDACTLLTAADVSSVVGIKSLPGRNPPPPVAGAGPVMAMCTYSATPDPGFNDPRVSVTLLSPTAASFNDAVNLPGATRTPVPGIGDKAVFVTFKAPGAVPYVAVRKGSGAFEVRVAGAKLTPAQKQSMETALARIAVSRL